MSEAPVLWRVRPRWVEILVIAVIAVTVVGLIVIGFVAAQRSTAGRIQCTSHFRHLGISMISFDTTNGGFPSDNHPAFAGQSFYQQILDNLELGDLAPNGKANPQGVAKPFVCPTRRKAADVPGACDYGYVASGEESRSVLDSELPVPGKVITNAAGTQNTALLSHLWMSPVRYDSATPGWASRTGHAVAFEKGTRGYDDSDPAGAGGIGGPHWKGIPCGFADGHVGILLYTHPQFRDLWDYSDSRVPRHNVP